MANRRLLLPLSLAEQIEDHAARAFPEECCGILMGVSRAADVVVHRIMAAENIAAGDRLKRYQIDWESLFKAVRETQDSPEAIVGFYHSHPDGSCQPSWTDHREAWIDYAYLIAGVSSCGVTDMGCWRVHREETPFVREIMERMASR